MLFSYRGLMAADVAAVVVDSVDPAGMGRFWSGLLGQPLTNTAEAGGRAAVRLADGVAVVFTPASGTKPRAKNPVHFDVATTSVTQQVELVEHARRMGAQTIDIGQGDTPWVVLADPEGNEFCVLEPREEYMGCGPLAAVVVDARDPTALARFWSDMTGLPVVRIHPGYASLRRPSGFWLEFVHTVDPDTSRSRLHLHLAPSDTDVGGQDVVRLVAAYGAKPLPDTVCPHALDRPVPFADLENNRFCIETTAVGR